MRRGCDPRVNVLGQVTFFPFLAVRPELLRLPVVCGRFEMQKFWISTEKFTCQMNVEDGFVVWAAPILKKFVGQPLYNVTSWCDQKRWSYVLKKIEDGMEKTYLGDGVYAAYDGYHIGLTTENGISVTNEIMLEPLVVDALLAYIERLKEGFKKP